MVTLERRSSSHAAISPRTTPNNLLMKRSVVPSITGPCPRCATGGFFVPDRLVKTSLTSIPSLSVLYEVGRPAAIAGAR